MTQVIERRGVRVRVEIEDTADPDFVAVSVYVDGDRIADRDTQGESYGPDFGGRYRANPPIEIGKTYEYRPRVREDAPLFPTLSGRAVRVASGTDGVGYIIRSDSTTGFAREDELHETTEETR